MKRGQDVKSLFFDETKISDSCLKPLLTSEFLKLEFLGLSDCKKRDNNTAYISMPETSLDSLEITSCDFINRRMLLISITSTERNITRYYIDVNTVDTPPETSQKNI